MEVFTQTEKDRIVDVKKTLGAKVIKALFDFPPELREFLSQGAILTGGASASIFHNEKINDLDLYLADRNEINRFNEFLKREEVLKLIAEVNPKYMHTIIEGKSVTGNATTFSNGIQVITIVAANDRETFDYVHCMPYLDIRTQTYYISREQFDSINGKFLRRNPKGVTNGNQHLYREQKFVSRGWKKS